MKSKEIFNNRKLLAIIIVIIILLIGCFFYPFIINTIVLSDEDKVSNQMIEAIKNGDIDKAKEINNHNITNEEAKEVAYANCKEQDLIELYPRDFINAKVKTVYTYAGNIYEYELEFENTSNYDVHISQVKILEDPYRTIDENPDKANVDFSISANSSETFIVSFGNGFKNENTKKTKHIRKDDEYGCYFNLEVL